LDGLADLAGLCRRERRRLEKALFREDDMSDIESSGGWQVGDPFKLTEDDALLVSLCNSSGLCYAGGFAAGWSGVIKEIRTRADVAVVNYFHQPAETCWEIPLAAAQQHPIRVGFSIKVIDDDAALVQFFQMRGVAYSGAFANGWTGVIQDIDAERGVAVMQYSHKPPGMNDILPLAAIEDALPAVSGHTHAK